MQTKVAIAGAMVVVTKIDANWSLVTAAAPLNPYQPNHRMNTPSAPNEIECPGMAFGVTFPFFLENFPIRGPTSAAPINAETPPTV